MTDTFLTVKEAARLVGKSPSSIRRVIYPIIESDAHPDRIHIQPSVEEAAQLRIKGENFAWKLSEELLRREVPLDTGPEKGSRDATRPVSGDEHSELLSMLRRELDIKNQQITQQNDLLKQHAELIGGLNERLRESNVLFATLQKQFSLTDGRVEKPENIVEAKPAPVEKNPKPEKGSVTSGKNAKPTKSKPGFFTRIFR